MRTRAVRQLLWIGAGLLAVAALSAVESRPGPGSVAAHASSAAGATGNGAIRGRVGCRGDTADAILGSTAGEWASNVRGWYRQEPPGTFTIVVTENDVELHHSVMERDDPSDWCAAWLATAGLRLQF